MWIKVNPDMELNLEVELQGIDERTRDQDVQLYEERIREALTERLRKVFADEDIVLYGMEAGIAREKYAKPRAA